MTPAGVLALLRRHVQCGTHVSQLFLVPMLWKPQGDIRVETMGRSGLKRKRGTLYAQQQPSAKRLDSPKAMAKFNLPTECRNFDGADSTPKAGVLWMNGLQALLLSLYPEPKILSSPA